MPDFLNPAAIAIAAAATIPPLVALYFLKLKRSIHVVPSTFLWKRAVEDLRVNAPFQRLRKSLLLLLQLLALAAGAAALGVPMCEQVDRYTGTLVLLIDQSASMSVVEEDGRTRLDKAKEQAGKTIDNMKHDARAMVISFCDRASVVASFDSDKTALKKLIDSIEPTDSRSQLEEALSLAEAYSQNIIIGGREEGADIAPTSAASPAAVFVYTDGRLSDGDRLSVERLKVESMEVVSVGAREDNVAILSMDTRRQYERPDILQVFASVRNYGPDAVQMNVDLYLDDAFVDTQLIELEGARSDVEGDEDALMPAAAPGSVTSVAFDEISFEGSGVVEIRLGVDDALAADDRAWSVVEPPRDIDVLLVTRGNFLLEGALACLPIQVMKMLPGEYEDTIQSDLSGKSSRLLEGDRSRFDVVMFDRVSTSHLPPGNYFFWGAAPKLEGVEVGRVIDDEIIFNWDDTHPVLRHVPVEGIDAFEWLELKLPDQAVSLIDGQTSPVLVYMTRGSSQYLINAFSIITEDEAGNPMLNTYWTTKPHFIVFLQNAIQYLASAVITQGTKSLQPGQPITIPVPGGVDAVTIRRPDAGADAVPSAGFDSIHYARTRKVGLYEVEPGVEGEDRFAVNLFDPVESHVRPRRTITIGVETAKAASGEEKNNRPAWHYFLLAMLAFIILEWIVYNRRVFV